MKKYMTPSIEEIKLVGQEHITAGSVDGSGYVNNNVPSAPGGKK